MAKIPQELIRDEEYKIWKKNTPYLYDTVGSYELEWPSLTVSWFPETVSEPGRKYCVQRLLLGTHTSGGEQNFLFIAQIKLPNEKLVLEEKFYNEETEYGGFGQGGSMGKLEVLQKINHPGEINRARAMPQNPDIMATKTNGKTALVFDRTKHPSEPPKDGKVSPEMTLTGHEKEGYGLSWSPFNEGQLLSGSDDGRVCLWNISREKSESLAPLRTFADHEGIVEDVAWHLRTDHFFGSASDDRTVRLWDARQEGAASVITGHCAEVNAVAFSPHSEFFLLSGSKDRTVGLWDLRNTSARLHMLEGHEDAVFRVEWSPTEPSVVASCGADRKVTLWDLSRVGREQSPEDAADGPPELLFVHGGHTDKVTDMAWNANSAWTMASVADDNVLQVWTVTEAIYTDDVDSGSIELE